MYYIIYKTTNNINNKIYIGKHKTADVNDSYLGSGKILKRAIKKYGIENFSKEILFVFDNEQEMNDKEAAIVTEDFINDNNVYNLCSGGRGGFDYINRVGLGDRTGMVHSEESRLKMGNEKTPEQIKKQSEFMIGNTYGSGKKGKPHTKERTDEHKRKISKSLFNSDKKHNQRPRFRYTIRNDVGGIDETTHLVKYCEERNLNYNYIKKGTKGYKIITKTKLRV